MSVPASRIDGIKSANERMKELNSRIVVDYSPGVSLPAYFRVCRSMLNMANDYEADGCRLDAYCLRRRFVILFLNFLSKRRDFETYDPSIRNHWSRECKLTLQKVEKMYEEILEDFKTEELELKKAFEASSSSNKADHVNSYLPGSISPDTNGISSSGVPNSSLPKSAPKIDRSTKPTVLPSTTHRVDGLHQVRVPNSLVPTFLRLAESNTLKKLETCGTLCGRLSHDGNELAVSHLIISKQIVTQNSCTTTNEEELLECIESSGLIVLGWIHTHPSQTAFMSSMDLHCQLSYQLMLPEAIAIVCSPKFNETAYFSLTPDYGLGFILQCQRNGFHEHLSTRDLYSRCKHVVFSDAPVEVCDLR
ncbi:hypothetical protein Aperf_G00000060717 [Anoplocephala perfoliata]